MFNVEKTPILHCPTCYATHFKTSKTRPDERLQRLLGKLPVRCRGCNTRTFAGRTYAKWLRKQEDGNTDHGSSTTGEMSASETAE